MLQFYRFISYLQTDKIDVLEFFPLSDKILYSGSSFPYFFCIFVYDACSEVAYFVCSSCFGVVFVLPLVHCAGSLCLVSISFVHRATFAFVIFQLLFCRFFLFSFSGQSRQVLILFGCFLTLFFHLVSVMSQSCHYHLAHCHHHPHLVIHLVFLLYHLALGGKM